MSPKEDILMGISCKNLLDNYPIPKYLKHQLSRFYGKSHSLVDVEEENKLVYLRIFIKQLTTLVYNFFLENLPNNLIFHQNFHIRIIVRF